MQLFLGKLAEILKDAKDKNKEYNKELKKLELSVEHAEYMQAELLRIQKINNVTYLDDIEAVMAALSESDLSEEIELFIQNYYCIKNNFNLKVENYNPSISGTDGIKVDGAELFRSYFNFMLDEINSYTGEPIKLADTSILDNSTGVQELVSSTENDILMEYNYQTGKVKYYDDAFQAILGKWTLVRYKDLTGKDLYDDQNPEKAGDLLTLTSLLISFYTFIQEEKENIIKYINEYGTTISEIGDKISKVQAKIVNVLIVIGSIIKADLYYTNSEWKAKRIIYRSYKFYSQINSVLQNIIDKNKLDVQLKHITEGDTYYNTVQHPELIPE